MICYGRFTYSYVSLTINGMVYTMATAKKTTPAKKSTAKVERPVLVTTEQRGVFFGYATETSGPVIHLRRARNVVYWPEANKGFLGLAADGPARGARVGPAADIELRGITCIAECTPASVAAFEAAPWS